MTKTAAEIATEHRTGAASPEETIAQCYARIRAHDDPAIFISLRDEADARAEARAMAAHPRANALPLLGVPVAVKDDTDVAGEATGRGGRPQLPPAERDAPTVAQLREVGAVLVGHTNTPDRCLWPSVSGPARCR